MEADGSEAHVLSGMNMALQEKAPPELVTHASEVSCLTLNDNYDMWTAPLYPDPLSGFGTSPRALATPDVTASRFTSAKRGHLKCQLSYPMMLPARSEQTASDLDSEMAPWDRPPTQEVLTPPTASGP
ncbi:hypothetical protein, unknown function [Leishmania tarentolae]|uniref:Uncharacterized protein n=1 Tax=Leishmania tarentolae TaxID=5689 RepID=A0A640KU57_LEITA|nr:hypothetical protein, unknown function [Leishmania tarentolae]